MRGKTVSRSCNEVVLNRNTKPVALSLDGLANGGWQGGKEEGQFGDIIQQTLESPLFPARIGVARSTWMSCRIKEGN